ncbi:MAG: hypothetical protein WC712_01675 [Candidatus Brocadiia bacterium]
MRMRRPVRALLLVIVAGCLAVVPASLSAPRAEDTTPAPSITQVIEHSPTGPVASPTAGAPQPPSKYAAHPPVGVPLTKTGPATKLVTEKYGDRKVLLDAFDSMPALRTRAIETISREYGLSVHRMEEIEFRITDLGEAKGRREGLLTAERISDHDKTVVVFYSEFIVNGMTDLDETVIHEMDHAIMKEIMPAAQYGALPKWFREASSIWIAGQGSHKMDLIFVGAFPLNPEAQIAGLGTVRGFNSYAEYYLAFDYINSKWGDEALRLLMQATVAGVDFRASFEGSLKVTMPEFLKGARKYAEDKAAQWLDSDPGIRPLMAGVDAYRGHDAACVPLLNKAISATGNDTVRSVATYYLGRWKFTSDDIAGALPLLRTVASRGSDNTFRDDALSYLGAVGLAAAEADLAALTPAQFADSESAYWELIFDHPYSGYIAEAHWSLGRLYRLTGHPAEALARFLHVTASFKNNARVKSAWVEAAEICELQGDRDHAVEYARNALDGHNQGVEDRARALLARLGQK